MKIFIIPILKFDCEARNFKSGENIFKYLVFDTINFESTSVFYNRDSFLFFISPGINNCTEVTISPGGKTKLPEGENIFYQNIYESNGNNCRTCYKRFNIDSLFQFVIRGMPDLLKIIDNSVCYSRGLGHGKYTWIKNQANQMLNEMYSEEWVHYCAKMCPPGGLKEKIVISKPNPYKKGYKSSK